MGRRNITKTWIEATMKLQLSPASAPHPWDSQEQDGVLQFLRDPHYFMHGEIIAFTAIAVFVIFLLFLIIPCVRRTISIPSSGSESSVSAKKRNCVLFMLRKRRADDDHEQHPWPPEPFDDDKNSGVQQPGYSSRSIRS